MNQLKEKLKKKEQINKADAISIVTNWVRASLENYKEPIRSGVRKGDPIGFSFQKKKAAYFMVLHPALQLREISKLTGVSEKVLRVWRTQKDFQDAQDKASEDLIEQIIGTIESHGASILGEDHKKENPGNRRYWVSPKFKDQEDLVFLLFKILKFMNGRIIFGVYEWITKRFSTDSPGYALLLFALRAGMDSGDLKAERNFLRNPQALETTKLFIGGYIDFLTIPENWTNQKRDEMLKRVEELKQYIFYTLDILAG